MTATTTRPARDTSSRELVSIAEVAALLGCSPSTVNRYRAEGKLPPPVRVGKLIRWPKYVIDNHLAEAVYGGPQSK